MTVDWGKRGDYIAKHDVTVAQASEAPTDPDAVVFNPDCNSRNGEGVRTIGFSPSAASALTVITYVMDGVAHGASAWKSNSRDLRYYSLGGTDE